MTNSNAKAIIFDMDGVLLDSETICDKTWEITRKEFGLPEGIDAINRCRGTNKTDSAIILRQLYGQDLDAESFLERCSDHFREVEFSTGIPLMPYVKEALSYLKPKYRMALASSTRGVSVKRQLTNAGLIDFFETLTTGDMVTHSKPDPEIYKMACASIGMQPSDCIAIEDSPNGVKSAAAAGLRVIMIPDKLPATDEIRPLCWKILDSLKGVPDIL